MRKLRRLFTFQILLSFILIVGCNGNTPPTLSPSVGLDERPDNAACIAPKRPGVATGTTKLALKVAYEELKFSEPIFMQQLPRG